MNQAGTIRDCCNGPVNQWKNGLKPSTTRVHHTETKRKKKKRGLGKTSCNCGNGHNRRGVASVHAMKLDAPNGLAAGWRIPAIHGRNFPDFYVEIEAFLTDVKFSPHTQRLFLTAPSSNGSQDSVLATVFRPPLLVVANIRRLNQ